MYSEKEFATKREIKGIDEKIKLLDKRIFQLLIMILITQ